MPSRIGDVGAWRPTRPPEQHGARRARFTWHGTFDLPDTPAHAAPASIEVRTLVVIDRPASRAASFSRSVP
jgi:hypothetical protein